MLSTSLYMPDQTSAVSIPPIYTPNNITFIPRVSIPNNTVYVKNISDNAAAITPAGTTAGYGNDNSSTIQAYFDRASLLESVYDFRDPEAVHLFLEQNPFLFLLLLEARSVISHYFPDTKVFLEVTMDPEAIDEEQMLAAIAVTSSAEEVFERLDRFDHEWWINAVHRAKGKLCINVEFE